jgi:hypothetical protein
MCSVKKKFKALIPQPQGWRRPDSFQGRAKSCKDGGDLTAPRVVRTAARMEAGQLPGSCKQLQGWKRPDSFQGHGNSCRDGGGLTASRVVQTAAGMEEAWQLPGTCKQLQGRRRPNSFQGHANSCREELHFSKFRLSSPMNCSLKMDYFHDHYVSSVKYALLDAHDKNKFCKCISNAIFYLFEKPHVTRRLPWTSKSDSVAECAGRTCSAFNVFGSRRVTCKCEIFLIFLQQMWTFKNFLATISCESDLLPCELPFTRTKIVI